MRQACGKSFRMSKHDLQARPSYHRQRDPIDAHLTIAMGVVVVIRLSWTQASQRQGQSVATSAQPLR
jgi:hypothetical protein